MILRLDNISQTKLLVVHSNLKSNGVGVYDHQGYIKVIITIIVRTINY